MMGIFINSFFSLEGQKERIGNVINTLKIAINPMTKEHIVANVSNPVAKASLEFVANNPYSTAGIIATAGTSAGRTAVVKAVGSLSTKTKVVASLIALPVAGNLLASPKSATTAIKVASQVTPEKLLKLGGGTGSLIENPTVSGLKEFASENKGTIAVAGAVTALTALPVVADLTSTYFNTRATRENRKTMLTTSEPTTQTTPEFINTGLTKGVAKQQKKQAVQVAELQGDTSVEVAKIQADKEIQLAKIQAESIKNVPPTTQTITKTTKKKSTKKKKKKVVKKKKKAKSLKRKKKR